MTEYQRRKNAVRNEAIFFQTYAAQKALSYGKIARWQAYFERLARRCGLLTEFRENDIL